MSDARTQLQRLVAEIGDEGQARITAALALVGEQGLGGEVEARYLAGAGFGCVRTSSHQSACAARETNPSVVISTDAPPITPPSEAMIARLLARNADPAVSAIAAGAAGALRQIRAIARVEPKAK
ncbi:MAG: hypothetical protein NVS3B20_04090 [Polyangiales bacterium]